ncbi:MAG: response regulator [Deltaproteobacteria bacterium]|nr:response regulator [Deltaproteobacteria bacterium]
MIPSKAVSITKKSEEINKDWESFLQVLVTYLGHGSESEFEANDIRSELEVFLNLPFSQAVSLFLHNEGTFEFNHHLSCPDWIDALAQKQFAALVYQGKIAQALNSDQGYVTFPHPDLMGGNHILILPLTVPSEILGLLLISLKRPIGTWGQGLLKLGLLQARQLAFSLSQKTMTRRLNNHQALLKQKIAERTQGLEQSQRELKTVLDSIKTGVIIIDQETHQIINANKTALEMMGHPKEAVLDSSCHSFCSLENTQCPIGSNPNRGLEHSETLLPKSNGLSIPILKSAVPVILGGRTCLIESFVDLSEHKHLEGQFYQSQKMEAIGRLAGGVAHDFNNFLMAIMGYCDLTLTGMGRGTPTRHFVEEINRAADRAASLTRQLLALSRKQVLQPLLLDLNSVLSDIKKMLLRIMGEDIELITRLEENLGPIKADKGQIEQVIMNLAINARDALPKGGKLIIETSNCDLDFLHQECHPVVSPGAYVVLTVSDTGEGMDKETQSQIFEPFFTTKGVGLGTGLGLSTVYGIVKQSGGTIWVYSELGQGTTIKIYLPRASGPLGNAETVSAPLTIPRGSETILLIEDEVMVRNSIKEGLEMTGYQVLDASNGQEALRMAQSFQDPIHLVLTDVVMPGLNGLQVAESLTAWHPETRVLYMSGYPDDAFLRKGLIQEKTDFLQKPFTPKALAFKVREILDAPAKPSRPDRD